MICRRSLLARAAALSLVLVAGKAPAQAVWKDWVGSKFGTRIKYPVDLFSIQPEPDAHDGRAFTAADGAQIAAYAVFTDVVDFESAVASAESDATSQVTYKRRDRNWAVVSGTRSIEGRPSIFYERYFLDPRKEVYHVVVITYPTDVKAKYDLIVGRIAGALDSSRYSR